MSRLPRIVPRQPSATGSRFSLASFRPAELLSTFRAYFGLGEAARMGPIDSPGALAHFIETRASYMAQTSLYGYLRTRMGMRYPELFDDDAFVVGVNAAKWQIWLDCLGDLAVHSGARIAQKRPGEVERVNEMMVGLVDEILNRTGIPPDSGKEFSAHGKRVRQRIARTNWLAVGDKEAAFTESPKSVVKWSPIIDDLKRLDEEIVINSVRFHWQEIRRAFARHIDADGLLDVLRQEQQH